MWSVNRFEFQTERGPWELGPVAGANSRSSSWGRVSDGDTMIVYGLSRKQALTGNDYRGPRKTQVRCYLEVWKGTFTIDDFSGPMPQGRLHQFQYIRGDRQQQQQLTGELDGVASLEYRDTISENNWSLQLRNLTVIRWYSYHFQDHWTATPSTFRHSVNIASVDILAIDGRQDVIATSQFHLNGLSSDSQVTGSVI